MSFRNPVIWYVEDDDDDAFFMERTFHRLGLSCHLVRFPSPTEARDILLGRVNPPSGTGRIPDAIITDLNLTPINGLEFVQWLRQAIDYKKPCYIFTSSDIHADKEAAARVGADGFHVKPVNPEHWETVARAVCTIAHRSLAGSSSS